MWRTEENGEIIFQNLMPYIHPSNVFIIPIKNERVVDAVVIKKYDKDCTYFVGSF